MADLLTARCSVSLLGLLLWYVRKWLIWFGLKLWELLRGQSSWILDAYFFIKSTEKSVHVQCPCVWPCWNCNHSSSIGTSTKCSNSCQDIFWSSLEHAMTRTLYLGCSVEGLNNPQNFLLLTSYYFFSVVMLRLVNPSY